MGRIMNDETSSFAMSLYEEYSTYGSYAAISERKRI